MKNQIIIIILLTMTLLVGCTRDQYKGAHISEAKQETLTDESNNYHVKETKRVLTKNERRNERNKIKCEKERLKQKNAELSTKTTKHKKNRSLVLDFY